MLISAVGPPTEHGICPCGGPFDDVIYSFFLKYFCINFLNYRIRTEAPGRVISFKNENKTRHYVFIYLRHCYKLMARKPRTLWPGVIV